MNTHCDNMLMIFVSLSRELSKIRLLEIFIATE